jgi:membrane protein DedA with SNARE-associated domain/rhodanese-related sulfurtransferase
VHDPTTMAGSPSLVLVFLTVFLNQLGLPIPAAPVLVLAGAATATAAQGVSGAAFFAYGCLACILAESGWFAAGRIHGTRVMRLICRLSLTPDSCVSETQIRFERWGWKALLVSKFVPGLSMVAPPLAGALRMPWSRFLTLTTLSSALWVGAFLAAGAILAPQIAFWWPRVAVYGRNILIGFGMLLGIYIACKWWDRGRMYRGLRMPRIDADELYALMDAPQAPIVVDVRSESARRIDPRWIPGALHVPPDQMGTYVTHLSHDRDIVLYCACPNDASAGTVAKRLMGHGFARVRPLRGGLDAWVAAGYPVDKAGVSPTPNLVQADN